MAEAERETFRRDTAGAPSIFFLSPHNHGPPLSPHNHDGSRHLFPPISLALPPSEFSFEESSPGLRL